MQISKLSDDARPKDKKFQQQVANQIGGTKVQAFVMGGRDVYRSSQRKQSLTSWFDGDYYMILAVRDTYPTPRALLRELLDESRGRLMRRAVALVAVVGLLAVGPACAKKNEDKLKLEDLLDKSAHSSGVFRYIDETDSSPIAKGVTISVRGLVEDDFRFKARARVSTATTSSTRSSTTTRSRFGSSTRSSSRISPGAANATRSPRWRPITGSRTRPARHRSAMPRWPTKCWVSTPSSTRSRSSTT